jgi:PEGA domain
VNRQVVIGSVAVALAAGAGLAIYLVRPEPARPAPVAAVAPTPAPPVVREAPPLPPPPAEPARPARRAAAAPVEAPPEAAPPPVAAAPDVGTLRIGADVAGAQVFLDRQFIGVAPVVAENVKPGTHQLNVSAEGFESFAGPIDVQPGTRDISVKFREVRLDARVAVIHRHGIGSCRGQLVATPQGIRYDTADSDDQFTTALLDLDTFQVDYIAKNLRLKLKRGKQFNFTDPEGNADRLFVFHRDVDKACERLAKGDTPASN